MFRIGTHYLALVTVIVLTLVITGGGNDAADNPMEPEVLVLPTYTFPFEESPKPIPITIYNGGDDDFKYTVNGEHFVDTGFHLQRDGKRFNKSRTASRAPVGPEDVRRIKPGSTATHPLDLSHWYAQGDLDDPWSLKPGVYVLHVGFYSTRNEGLLTQAHQESRPFAAIVIEEPD